MASASLSAAEDEPCVQSIEMSGGRNTFATGIWVVSFTSGSERSTVDRRRRARSRHARRSRRALLPRGRKGVTLRSDRKVRSVFRMACDDTMDVG